MKLIIEKPNYICNECGCDCREGFSDFFNPFAATAFYSPEDDEWYCEDCICEHLRTIVSEREEDELYCKDCNRNSDALYECNGEYYCDVCVLDHLERESFEDYDEDNAPDAGDAYHRWVDDGIY